MASASSTVLFVLPSQFLLLVRAESLSAALSWNSFNFVLMTPDTEAAEIMLRRGTEHQAFLLLQRVGTRLTADQARTDQSLLRTSQDLELRDLQLGLLFVAAPEQALACTFSGLEARCLGLQPPGPPRTCAALFAEHRARTCPGEGTHFPAAACTVASSTLAQVTWVPAKCARCLPSRSSSLS